MKKVFLLILLCLFISPFMANAASGTESYNGVYRWNYEDGLLTITSDGGNMISNLPQHSWDGYKSEIKKIVFEGIDVIHAHNFENYPNLEEVILDDNMGGEIADYAFYNCPKLEYIDLPDGGLSRIGKYAFYGTSIKEVEIPIFLSWVDENAFPDDTIIVKRADELGVLDAGTAGKLTNHLDGSFPGEGYANNNTCYNKFYYGKYYDNSAKWILYKDGTLLVYGTDLVRGYANSRVPWGCYKKYIKKVIFNIDKTGKLSVNDDCCKNGNNYKIVVYASKSVEDIMNNRIKTLVGNMFWDCREECSLSSFNVDTVVINRGVETIEHSFQSVTTMVDRNIYINKYVKRIDEGELFATDNNDPKKTTLHVGVSSDDYISNNYSYKVIYNINGALDILDGNNFITNPDFTSDFYSGEIINNIDNTYVSINDSSVPETIDVDGKTYYKYETYITNENREVNVSLPIDDSVDYYVKELESPNGCSVKEDAVHVDMSNPEIDLSIQHDSSKPDIINPMTIHNFIIVIIISFLLITIFCWSFRDRENHL